MKTKLTLLALAVSATVAAPAALAQNVEIYGKLYPYLLDESGSGATATGTPVATMAKKAAGVNGVTSQNGMMGGKNSNWGLRGSEDLGGGMKAQFQLEGTAPVDTGGDGSPLFSRNTFVGLTGNFGTIHLGNMDTIFKSYGDVLGVAYRACSIYSVIGHLIACSVPEHVERVIDYHPVLGYRLPLIVACDSSIIVYALYYVLHISVTVDIEVCRKGGYHLLAYRA